MDPESRKGLPFATADIKKAAERRKSSAQSQLDRCWLACWVALVIILPKPSLAVLGPFGFFAFFMGFFLPPYLPVQMFLNTMFTVMIGILSGWGVGAAAMRAALASRDFALLQRQNKTVAASAAGAPDPSVVFGTAILEGVFLDTRSSAVYGCFLGMGTFAFALIRAYSPKLVAPSIFGTISIDIFCAKSFGPLYPQPNYLLLDSLLISISSYFAIALLVTIFVFPETMNHEHLAGTITLLGGVQEMMNLQDRLIGSGRENPSKEELAGKIKAIRQGIIAKMQNLMTTSGTIDLEVSLGRWNGDEVRALEEPLLAVVTRVAGLESIIRLMTSREGSLLRPPSAGTSIDSFTLPTSDADILHQLHLRHQAPEEISSAGLWKNMPAIEHCTRDLRAACSDGLAVTQETLMSINKCRWCLHDSGEVEDNVQRLDEALGHLSDMLVQFKETKRLVLIDPYLSSPDPARTSPDARNELPTSSLYVTYMISGHLIMLGDDTISLMQLVRDTAKKRTKRRLWAPKGLRALSKLFSGRTEKLDATVGEVESPASDFEELEEKQWKRDPDSRPPTNPVQKVMNGIHVVWRWARTAEALFAFKYAFISVALWLPAVFHKTAHLYFINRGVWALILAQTTLNIYAADQIYNIISRVLGTFVGLVLSLAAWYIGDGKSSGNPYGLAAVTAGLLVPIVFLRLFFPLKHQVGVTLMAATFTLVIGYSWVDSHVPQPVTLGTGWSVAWKRWTLVIIGAAASFIVMIIPPTSGRKAVRLRNASTIRRLSSLYAALTSAWFRTGTIDQEHGATLSTWRRQFRSRLIALMQKIQGNQQLTDLARWEGSIRGHWPVDEYMKLEETQLQMLASVGQLGGALSHLEDDWRLALVHSTRGLNPNFIGDVLAVFSLVSQSLRTGEPMHQAVPYPLVERVCYHHRRDPISGKEERANTYDDGTLRSLNMVCYTIALISLYQLLEALDELHRITKTLCGEIPLAGFEHWREEYNRAHQEV